MCKLNISTLNLVFRVFLLIYIFTYFIVPTGQFCYGSANNSYSMTNDQYMNNNYDEKRPDRKFTGRCRLFIGNLPTDLSEAYLYSIE